MSLAFAAEHGAAVSDAGHHQLNAVPQQGHSGSASRIYPRYYRDIEGNIRGGTNLTDKYKKVIAPTVHTHILILKHQHMSGKSYRELRITQ